MTDYWINVQKKAFLRWCNHNLKKRDIQIETLENDFQDGTKLIQLLEILTSKTIKHNRSPRMKVQKYENLTLAFKFMTEGCKITLVNLGPEDVYDSNLRLILGLIWALILHFKVKANADDGGNKDLLEWVRSKIPTYNIKNFTTDWQSGKAICALADALLKDGSGGLLNFSNNPISDCTRGVQYAEDSMLIPRVMDIDDIVNYPDQHSMMTYLTYFREYDMAHAKKPEEKKKEDLNPDLNNCLVYGPGIENDNLSGKSTYFSIEVRNAENLKIPSSHHDIKVRIIGPNDILNPRAINNEDGTSFIEYLPSDSGYYTVEVKLNNQHLSESPFTVNIQAPPPEIVYDPEPRWFIFDEEHKKLVSYDTATNDTIESTFKVQNYGGCVEVINKTFKIDMSKRLEFNLKKSFFSLPTRHVIRGTWFWQTDNNSWAPYDEDTASKLEKAFNEGRLEGNQRVEWIERKKVRWVKMEADGSFRQYRQDGDRKEGRKVTRGYLGNLVARK
eukprot:TRINITY_DN2905_c1_g1_i1.p1 TRINITY_DN2905_c1_g1~~TRINITY_DN2905_c1_g1_i1.p1  ORF type:complete len:501 (+),score=122.27 TRINITY_DN2905_c1_g1_i1:97-1599(+)